jgi:hypothetical protein
MTVIEKRMLLFFFNELLQMYCNEINPYDHNIQFPNELCHIDEISYQLFND